MSLRKLVFFSLVLLSTNAFCEENGSDPWSIWSKDNDTNPKIETPEKISPETYSEPDSQIIEPLAPEKEDGLLAEKNEADLSGHTIDEVGSCIGTILDVSSGSNEGAQLVADLSSNSCVTAVLTFTPNGSADGSKVHETSPFPKNKVTQEKSDAVMSIVDALRSAGSLTNYQGNNSTGNPCWPSKDCAECKPYAILAGKSPNTNVNITNSGSIQQKYSYSVGSQKTTLNVLCSCF